MHDRGCRQVHASRCLTQGAGAAQSRSSHRRQASQQPQAHLALGLRHTHPASRRLGDNTTWCELKGTRHVKAMATASSHTSRPANHHRGMMVLACNPRRVGPCPITAQPVQEPRVREAPPSTHISGGTPAQQKRHHSSQAGSRPPIGASQGRRAPWVMCV